MKHVLKIWPQYFDAVASGAKPFEARSTEDRTFSVGDVLQLEEWDPAGEFPNRYTGRIMERTVTYVLADGLEWKGKPCAILGLAQLTAQPDGVPCMGECGQEAWAIHYKEAVKQALEEMQDREFFGAKRTLEEALKLATPAASTPPEGKVLPMEAGLEAALDWAVIKAKEECYPVPVHKHGAVLQRLLVSLQALAAPAPALEAAEDEPVLDVTGACDRCGKWEYDKAHIKPNGHPFQPKAPAPARCEACRIEGVAGSTMRPHTCEKSPAPACKKCGGTREVAGWPSHENPLAIPSRPCPDCNAGEGEK